MGFLPKTTIGDKFHLSPTLRIFLEWKNREWKKPGMAKPGMAKPGMAKPGKMGTLGIIEETIQHLENRES